MFDISQRKIMFVALNLKASKLTFKDVKSFEEGL